MLVYLFSFNLCYPNTPYRALYLYRIRIRVRYNTDTYPIRQVAYRLRWRILYKRIRSPIRVETPDTTGIRHRYVLIRFSNLLSPLALGLSSLDASPKKKSQTPPLARYGLRPPLRSVSLWSGRDTAFSPLSAWVRHYYLRLTFSLSPLSPLGIGKCISSTG